MFVPIREGAMIGARYRVESVLGNGAIGPLVVATDLHLDQRVVVRVLRPELAASEEHVERFLREVRRAAKLRSAHVARIHDVGRIELGVPYVVTEHLEGTDLAARCRERGPLPLQEAVSHVIEACDGVGDAHATGLVHGDLRPESLFLERGRDGRGSIKVLDFGLSRLPISPPSHVGTDEATALLGTPSRRSADLAPVSQAVDVRPDVRALGTILAKLVTGDVEWPREGLREMPSPRPVGGLKSPALPEAIAEVLARCADTDPAVRWRTVADLAKALRPYAGEAPRGRSIRRRDPPASSDGFDEERRSSGFYEDEPWSKR